MHDYSLNHWPLPAYWVHKYFKNYLNTYLPNRPEKFLGHMACILKAAYLRSYGIWARVACELHNMHFKEQPNYVLTQENKVNAEGQSLLPSFTTLYSVLSNKMGGKKFASTPLSTFFWQLAAHCFSCRCLWKSKERRKKWREGKKARKTCN